MPKRIRTGEKNPNWKGGKVEVFCQYCGEPFKVKLSILKSGRGKYHTRKCYRLSKIGTKQTEEHKNNSLKAQKGRIGENNPNWKGGEVEIICKQCGKHKKVKISEVKNGNGKYCNNKCYYLAQTGENHWRWSGGKKEKNKRQIEKRKCDLKYQINSRIRGLIKNCLKNGIKNGRHWQSLVGYTYKQLKIRLQSTMPLGYTWQDFLSGKLHIDHIIPISAFNFNKPEDLGFKQCWALSNLRLIPKKENLKKGSKLIRPFQTKLRIAI